MTARCTFVCIVELQPVTHNYFDTQCALRVPSYVWHSTIREYTACDYTLQVCFIPSVAMLSRLWPRPRGSVCSFEGLLITFRFFVSPCSATDRDSPIACLCAPYGKPLLETKDIESRQEMAFKKAFFVGAGS